MTTPFTQKPRSHRGICLMGALVLASAAFGAGAATTNGSTLTPEQKYQADVAHCKSGQTSQGEATCLKEAGAALEEARRHRLSNGQTSFQQDKTRRCQALPVDQQQDCMALMSGQGESTTTGSVSGGGVLRETVITIPAQPDTTTSPATTSPAVPGVSTTPVQ